jgi:predicted dithiol-disulfide oxidoreductase (DUF899 family)
MVAAARDERTRVVEEPMDQRETQMTDHKIGTREEWLAAREQLLAREKEHTRLGDELAQQRRELPRVRVEKEYRFDTDEGEKSLGELFDGRVSQAPLEKLQAHKRRMGWSVPWVSSAPSDFNFDLGFSHTAEQGREAVAQMTRGRSGKRFGHGVTGLPPIVEQNARATGTDPADYLAESPGFSTFVRDDGGVYHTYSTQGRGLEFLMSYYPILDHSPRGRDEGEAWQLWLRRHDEYERE